MTSTGERKDPFKGYNFKIEVGGITRAGFREASGLEPAQDPSESRDGVDKLTARKLPSLNKTITLKRGVTNDAELWAWRKKSIEGTVDRKNGSIVLTDDTGEEKVRWNFVKGWPTKWTGPSFSAAGNEVAIETLEITHEGLEKK
jgi:phage tail-like protein